MSDGKKLKLRIEPAQNNFNPVHNSTNINPDGNSSPFQPNRRLARSPPLTPIEVHSEGEQVKKHTRTNSLPDLQEQDIRRITRSVKQKQEEAQEKEKVLPRSATTVQTPTGTTENQPQSSKKPEVNRNTEEKTKSKENVKPTTPDITTEAAIGKTSVKVAITNENLPSSSNANILITTTPKVQGYTLIQKNNTTGQMDTTIVEAMAAAKTPAVPTFINPQTFHPSKRNASNFINNYERTAIANGWDNTLKIAYFGSFLEGAANLWYKIYAEDPKHAQKQWSNIKDDFLAEFEDPDIVNSIREKIENRKQKSTETVLDFYYEIKTLCYELDPKLGMDECIKYFKKGLSEETAYHYHWLTHPPNDVPTTWDEIKKLAITIDKAPKAPQPSTSDPQPTYQNFTKYTQNANYPPRAPSHNQNFNYRSTPQQHNYRNQNYNNNYNQQPKNNFLSSYNNQRGKWQSGGNNQQANTSISREFRPTYQGHQRLQGGNNVPLTRTPDNRPRCYNCNRPGHFAVACPNNNQIRHPNGRGRRN